MKGWLHIVAAVLGLALAGLIVYVVFARTTGGLEGQDESALPLRQVTECSSIAPAQGTNDASVERARQALPEILNERGVLVTPDEAGQVAWFARLHAASGLCVDEVEVKTKSLSIAVSYPDTVSANSVDSYTFALLTRAFEPPLARSQVTLVVDVAGVQRGVHVSSHVWQNFRRSRAAMGYDPSVRDLARFGKRVGFKPVELAIAGYFEGVL